MRMKNTGKHTKRPPTKNWDTLVNHLQGVITNGHPPVHQWRPDHSGSIDIVIQRDGTWLHEGDPIRRPELVRLFASVLWKEDADYFLKTPAEQLKITVEEAPFIINQLAVIDPGCYTQQLVFTSHYGDVMVAGPEHPVTVKPHPEKDEPAPYITVRYGMPGKLSRAVFYQLAEQANLEQDQLWIYSNHTAFSLGSVLEV